MTEEQPKVFTYSLNKNQSLILQYTENDTSVFINENTPHGKCTLAVGVKDEDSLSLFLTNDDAMKNILPVINKIGMHANTHLQTPHYTIMQQETPPQKKHYGAIPLQHNRLN